MSIQLTAKQSEAVDMAVDASRNRGQVKVLAGFAGTGKSSTLEEVCHLLPGSVLLAPTGRAAVRITELTGHEASTIHKWMYKPVIDEKTGKILYFERRDPSSILLPASGLLVIDEASMLNKQVWEDIHSLAQAAHISILLVGDCFQLPPVTRDDEDEFSIFLDSFPHNGRVDLTEVFRQALESPVLRAATTIRQIDGWGATKEAISEFVVPVQNHSIKEAAHHLYDICSKGADAAIISYTNAVRHDVNRKVRLEYQIDPDGDPLDGEPLLVRRNSYHAGIFNGQIVDYSGIERYFSLRKYRYVIAALNGVRCTLGLSELLGGAAPPFEELRVLRNNYVSANLGYCLTAHAAQGSQFNDVIIIFERKLLKMMDETQRRRWTYTSLTRAKENVSIYTTNN